MTFKVHRLALNPLSHTSQGQLFIIFTESLSFPFVLGNVTEHLFWDMSKGQFSDSSFLNFSQHLPFFSTELLFRCQEALDSGFPQFQLPPWRQALFMIPPFPWTLLRGFSPGPLHGLDFHSLDYHLHR